MPLSLLGWERHSYRGTALKPWASVRSNGPCRGRHRSGPLVFAGEARIPILFCCGSSIIFPSIGEESLSRFRKTTPFIFQVHLLEDVGHMDFAFLWMIENGASLPNRAGPHSGGEFNGSSAFGLPVTMSPYGASLRSDERQRMFLNLPYVSRQRCARRP
jgi:hypothetical protein